MNGNVYGAQKRKAVTFAHEAHSKYVPGTVLKSTLLMAVQCMM